MRGEKGEPRPKLKQARRMRGSPSVAERILWKLLRGRRLEGCKFRRQVPIGPYVADFVCLEHRLVVEADSALHDAARDARRDDWMRAEGFRVLRFANSEVTTRPENVLMAIVDALPGTTDALRPLSGVRPR